MKLVHIIPSLEKERCGIKEHALFVSKSLNGISIENIGSKQSFWREELAKLSPDCVLLEHEYQFFYSNRLRILKQYFKGIPFILDQHTVSPNVHDENLRLAESVDQVLVHSKKAYDYYLSNDITNVTLLQLPFDLSKRKLVSKDIVKRSMKTENRFLIGFFGMFYAHKGIKEIILALCYLKSQNRELFDQVKIIINASLPSNLSNVYHLKQCEDIANQYDLESTDSLQFFMNYESKTIILSRLAACDAIFLPYIEHGGYAASAALTTCSESYVPIFTSNTYFFDTIPDQCIIKSLNSVEDIMDAISNLVQKNNWSQYVENHKDFMKKNSIHQYTQKLIDVIKSC